MRKRKFSKLAVGAVAASVLLTGGVVGSALAADNGDAPVLSFAVTHLDGSELDKKGVPANHPIRIGVEVDLPAGAAVGDTFEFRMANDVLVGIKQSFDIVERGTTTVIGTCDRDVNVVCTLTSAAYFDSHKDEIIHGSVTLTDRLDELVKPSYDRVQLFFGHKQGGTVNVKILPTEKIPLNINAASKTGKYIKGSKIEWLVRIPRAAEIYPIIVEDYPGIGQDCSNSNAQLLEYVNPQDDTKAFEEGELVSVANSWGGYNFTIDKTPRFNHQQWGLKYTCDVTDSSLADIANAGFISDGRGQYFQVNGSVSMPTGSAMFFTDGGNVDANMYITKLNNKEGTLVTDPVTNERRRQLAWEPPQPASGLGVIPVSGKGVPGETVEVYRDRWIKGKTTLTPLTCTALVDAKGNWTCVTDLRAYPVDRGISSWEQGSWQALNVRTVRNGQTVIGAPEFWSISGKSCPLAIDFAGNNTVQTVTAAVAPGRFDLLNTGVGVESGWLAPSAGFVAVDIDGDGQISSRAELFGGGIGEGFAQLAAYDSNGDGIVDANDARFGELSIWRDANMNKIVDAGELVSLADAGVASLSLDHTDFETIDAAGNVVYERSTAVLSDGSSAALNDVYFTLGS